MGGNTEAPHRIPVGDVEVAVLEAGDPSGPPAVLVPGLTDGLAPVTEPRTWALLDAVPLPMAHHRCLVASHREPARAPLTTRRLAAALVVALERLLDRPAILIAHSMGAMVAQHLAADRPDLVAALVLSATSPCADDGVRDVLAVWDGHVRAGRLEALARAAVDASFTGPERDRRRRLVAATPPEVTTPTRVARYLALSAACATHDALDRLPSVTAPALVLAGTHDPIMPLAHAELLADRLADARLTVFAGLAHGFPEQAPDRFAARVTRFLAEVG